MPPPPASPATRILLPLLAALGLLLPAPAPAEDPHSIEGITSAQQPIAPHMATHDAIPPAPAGLILDQAHVLLPEIDARLSAKLAKALALDVHVYVVTIPSLHTPTSKQFDRLQELSTAYSSAWNKRNVGAVILFDDESGLITVDLSKLTSERFTTFAVEDKLKIPLGEAQKTGLAREKIERFGELTAATLSKLQTEYLKESRRQRISNLIMGTVALLGIGLAIFSAIPKRQTQSGTAPEPAVKSEPPTDF